MSNAASSPPADLFMTAPEPVPGCDVCGALAIERSEARRRGDLSKVSDVNVEIRKHPHAKRRRR
jgi:hypothetical protein